MSRGGDDSDPHLAWALTLLEMVTIVSCVLGSALNSIIIILFIRRRGFRTTSNRLVLNLVIANIFSVMVETSGSVTGLLVPGDSNLCSAWFFLHSMLSSNILLSTLVIGLDQYLAIVTPLHYHNIVNKTKLIGVCLLVWATGSASALVDLFTAPSHSVYCGQAEESSDISSRSHQIATFLHLVVLSSVPLVALIFIHIRIFSSAHTNSVRIRRNSTSSERRPSASLASPLSLQPGLTRSPSLWSKLSSAGQLLYREETRAARVSLVVVTMVGLTWAPEAGLRVMVGVMGQAPPPWLARLRVTLLALYSALSPVMFSLRSRRVQREGQAPEDETSADAGQAQVPQLPPPSAHLLSEFPGRPGHVLP